MPNRWIGDICAVPGGDALLVIDTSTPCDAAGAHRRQHLTNAIAPGNSATPDSPVTDYILAVEAKPVTDAATWADSSTAGH